MSTDCTGRLCLLSVIAEHLDPMQVCIYTTYEAIRCPSDIVTYDGECGIAVPTGNCSNCEACFPASEQQPIASPGAGPTQTLSMLHYCRPTLAATGLSQRVASTRFHNGIQLVDEYVIDAQINPGVTRRLRMLWVAKPDGATLGLALEAGDQVPPTLVAKEAIVVPFSQKGVSCLVPINGQPRHYVGYLP